MMRLPAPAVPSLPPTAASLPPAAAAAPPKMAQPPDAAFSLARVLELHCGISLEAYTTQNGAAAPPATRKLLAR